MGIRKRVRKTEENSEDEAEHESTFDLDQESTAVEDVVVEEQKRKSNELN